ncbi:MAG: hypothetical protein QXM92_01555 [Candidatus Anstonellales archaeon]
MGGVKPPRQQKLNEIKEVTCNEVVFLKKQLKQSNLVSRFLEDFGGTKRIDRVYEVEERNN